LNIPKNIENKILRSAAHRAKANMMNAEIRDWLERRGCANDTVLDQLIDNTEMGYCPSGFIHFLEQYSPEGNTHE
jgi:hypothetical protein